MQIHPLVPMRKAADLLGVEKNQLKSKLLSGEIKGEQRRVGSKDKWFVYASEVSNRIDTERLPELMKRTQMTDGQLAFELETEKETALDPLSLNDLDSFFEEGNDAVETAEATQILESMGETQLAEAAEATREIEPTEASVETVTKRKGKQTSSRTPAYKTFEVEGEVAEAIRTNASERLLEALKPQATAVSRFTDLAHAPTETVEVEMVEAVGGLPAPLRFHQIFESLTVVFSQRISDEYQQRLIAEQKVKTAEARAKIAETKTKALEENIKRLQSQRDEAQFVVDERNSTIAELEQEIRDLEQMAEKQPEVKKPSFWQRFFGI